MYVGARQNPILQFINIQFISSNYYDLNRKLLLLAKVNFSKPKHTHTHKHTIIVLIFEGYFLSISNISFCKNSLVIILHDSQGIILDCKKWICWLFELIKVVLFPSHTNEDVVKSSTKYDQSTVKRNFTIRNLKIKKSHH